MPPLETVTVTGLVICSVSVPDRSTVKGATVPLNAEKTIGLFDAVVKPFVLLVFIRPVDVVPLAFNV